MALLTDDLTKTYVFDPPEVEVYQRNQALMNIPSCENRLTTGSFYSIANKPTHGTKINKPISGDVDYVIFSDDTAFSSSMDNCRIRFYDLEIDNIIYDDIRGVVNSFSGTTQTDFISSVKRVQTSKTLFLDRPIVISNVSLKNNVREEDSAYFERRSTYYVTNIKNGKYEIIHTSITPTNSLTGGELAVPELIINLKNLKFTSIPTTFRILKQSLNTPGTPAEMSAGDISSFEVLRNNNMNPELRDAGVFYNEDVLSNYWLSTVNINIQHSPDKLIDSATITFNGSDNSDEVEYVIFKENTPEGGPRTPEYVSPSYQTGSEWYTSPSLFPNFAISPEAFYSCSLEDPYIQSIEVNLSGSVFNSNPIKLYKDVKYEFSVDWSFIRKNNPDFSLNFYYINTSPTGFVRKQLIGKIDKDIVKSGSGVYKNTFVSKTTMFGTIIIVPKYITSSAISNISIKPYQDDDYAIDMFSMYIPVDSLIKNEKLKLTVDFFDEGGLNCSNTLSKIVYLDPAGYTELRYGSGAGLPEIVDGGGP
jgi:hypothetical protein